MNRQVIVITGAAGFLGSATTVDLARDHRVVALDRRTPSRALLAAAPDATWWRVDIADAAALASIFERTRETLGRIDFVVHFAAYYHFGTARHREYDRTNIRGTDHVLQAARKHGVRRVIFASSIAATLPPAPNEVLTERTATAGYIPYAATKSVGEMLVREAAEHVPGIVLRFGGVFSDWCELPPLYALIRLWAGRSPLRCVVVGQGATGMPFVHRRDVARIVRCCLDCHARLARFEVFLACQQGAVAHRQLFSRIRQLDRRAPARKPMHLSPRAAKLGLYAQYAAGCCIGRLPFERPWMLDYADRPWVADITYTQRKLGWQCADGMGVLDRLPIILDHFWRDRRIWERRNRLRNRRQYAYHAPEN